MKKAHAYLIGAVMISTSLIISQGCTKSTDDDEDLIGNWKKSDDFEGNARSEAASFTIGDFAYVCSGTTATERFKDLWEYSTSRRYWIQKADLPGVARNSAIAFSIGTKGYVGTGYDGSTRLKDFWEYDQASDTWSPRADFAGTARYDAVAFSVDGKGYIGCGYDGNYLKDFWQYDPVQNQWNQKASVGGSKRSAAMAFVVNGQAFICSGNNNGEIQKDLWAYNAASNEWTEKTKIYDYSEDDSYDDDYGTIPRQNGVTFVIGNYVYLATGESNSVTNTTTWQYDPATDRWTEKTGFEGTARTGAVGFSLNNRGFVTTGRNVSLVMDNTYELLPNDEQVDND
ncbi:MAG: galactose oxidase [Chitinophagaceae bacterium]|nr:MAG: galactose oxidase [Chitinophagaceae bacterium]